MKKYWQSLEQLKPVPGVKSADTHKNDLLGIKNPEEKPTSRRDFLKFCGFSVTTAAIVSSCEKPVQKAIPYLIKPEEVTPGKANYYASGYFDGEEYASVLVKVRDGRPIKIEGNNLSPINKGAVSARVQASVLSLYDSGRYKTALKNNTEITWDKADTEIIAAIKKAGAEGKKVAILTPGIISPSTQAAIQLLQKKHSHISHVQYNVLSYSALRNAHDKIFEVAAIPTYNFGKASLILGFNADFLGTYLSPIAQTKQYTSARNLVNNKKLSKHIQFESHMSVTGSNADERYPIKPSEEKALLAHLYNALAVKNNKSTIKAPETALNMQPFANELLEYPNKSLVLSGTNDKDIQLLVAEINAMLGNYGNTIMLEKTYKANAVDDNEVTSFLNELENSTIAGLISWNVNPLYDLFNKKQHKAFKNLSFSISLDTSPNETAFESVYNCPSSHYLESWDDAEPISGLLCLSQPCIHKIYNTRQAQESLLQWSNENTTYYDFIKAHWKNNFYKYTSAFTSFEKFWTKSLQDGVFEAYDASNKGNYTPSKLTNEITDITNGQGIELIAYPTIAFGSGKQVNNPWLHEMPDPITKVCWDNYAAISVKFAKKHQLTQGDVITINNTIELPVLIQAGQPDNVIAVPMGFGHNNTGKVADTVGENIFKILKGSFSHTIKNVSISKTGKNIEFALTQTHHTMEGREIVREASLEEYTKDPYAGNHFHLEAEKHHTTMYKEVKYDGYHWGMAINLNSCTGCGACTIACQAENNIPVVGREQVKRRRIMHWIRIDRYYTDNPENPKVYHQPVMCQHCDNAPCENVCPVSATNHSNEGLNQMAYNRCIGTKYCINNCPYRVRRFNWFKYVNNENFDYNQNDELEKMVLNPDVVVRERGVVEKCSFCVQRIQEKKLTAKLESRSISDGEITPACAQTCPGDAIVFGDLNDKNSNVSKLFKNERNYHLLEQLHTLPSVGYLTKIRNTKPDDKYAVMAAEQKNHH